MALDFPTSPTEGEQYVSNNVRYVYSETKGFWYTLSNVNQVLSLTTSNVAEGSNLYFTNTRAISALTANENMEISANGLITANVSVSAGADTGAVALPHPFLLAGM